MDDLLRLQGYGVRLFPRGRMALAATSQQSPDLVLLNVNMPFRSLAWAMSRSLFNSRRFSARVENYLRGVICLKRRSLEQPQFTPPIAKINQNVCASVEL
jgi:CheY-like chemotaxis protein